MGDAFLQRVRSQKFAFKERFSEDVERHAHDVFRRVAKTAQRYAVTSEPAEILVESAKNKHGNSFAGLLGSMHGGLLDRPLYGTEIEDEEWFERGYLAYQAFENEMTSFLVAELTSNPLPRTEINGAAAEAGDALHSKIKAKNADLREKVSPSIQEMAGGVFRSVCKSADAFEKQELPAKETINLAITENEAGFSSLLSALEAELISGVCDQGRGWHPDRAAARSKEVVEFFKRDLWRFLTQQVVELRTERIENARN